MANKDVYNNLSSSDNLKQYVDLFSAVASEALVCVPVTSVNCYGSGGGLNSV